MGCKLLTHSLRDELPSLPPYQPALIGVPPSVSGQSEVRMLLHLVRGIYCSIHTCAHDRDSVIELSDYWEDTRAHIGLIKARWQCELKR